MVQLREILITYLQSLLYVQMLLVPLLKVLCPIKTLAYEYSVECRLEIE